MATAAPGALPRTGSESDRIVGFDGVRALAALMVVVYHAVFFASWFATPGGMFLWNLNAGVWIFFVTSGFLLYRPFVAAHLGARSGPGVGAYAIRRAARIYPAYWLAVAFFVWVVPRVVVDASTGWWRHLLLVQTYVRSEAPFGPFGDGLPPAWSLVVEVTFYAFLPLYAALIGAVGRRGRPVAVEWAGVLVLVGVGLAATGVVARGDAAPWLTILPQHLPAFAAGIALAVARTAAAGRSAARVAAVGARSGAWWGAAFAVFVAIPLVLGVRPFVAPGAPRAFALDVMLTVFATCVVTPVAWAGGGPGRLGRLLRSRVAVGLGTVSYGIFLWHWFVLVTVQDDWLGRPVGDAAWPVLLALALPVVLVAATVSWFAVERPVLRLAHGLTRERRVR
ncbi:MAG: acyltransferase family protein [Actinomycetota bacterium]